MLYFSGWSDRRYIATVTDPYKLTVQDGKFEVGVTTHQGLVRLINTKNVETMIKISDKGHKIGYDLEMLYVQRPDSIRKPLLSLKLFFDLLFCKISSRFFAVFICKLRNY